MCHIGKRIWRALWKEEINSSISCGSWSLAKTSETEMEPGYLSFDDFEEKLLQFEAQ